MRAIRYGVAAAAVLLMMTAAALAQNQNQPYYGDQNQNQPYYNQNQTNNQNQPSSSDQDENRPYYGSQNQPIYSDQNGTYQNQPYHGDRDRDRVNQNQGYYGNQNQPYYGNQNQNQNRPYYGNQGSNDSIPPDRDDQNRPYNRQSNQNQPYANQPYNNSIPPNQGNLTILAGPIPQDVTDHDATLWWETNAPGPTIVKYGTDQNNLAQVAEVPWGRQSHSVHLTSLQPNTTYYYQVQRPNGQVVKQGEFHTQDTGALKNEPIRITDGPRIEFLGRTRAVVAWTTDKPSSTVVKYGTSATSLTQTAEQPWGQTTHRVTINGLQPGATYYFAVQSGQAQGGNGAMAQSQPAMFQTVTSGAGIRIAQQQQ